MLLLTTSLLSVLSRVDAVAAADTSTVLNACCLMLLLLLTVQLMSRCPSQARFPRRSDPHLVFFVRHPAACRRSRHRACAKGTCICLPVCLTVVCRYVSIYIYVCRWLLPTSAGVCMSSSFIHTFSRTIPCVHTLLLSLLLSLLLLLLLLLL